MTYVFHQFYAEKEKSFKTDYKKLNKEECAETDAVIKKLLNGEVLEEKYREHEFHGNYKDYKLTFGSDDKSVIKTVFQIDGLGRYVEIVE